MGSVKYIALWSHDFFCRVLIRERNEILIELVAIFFNRFLRRAVCRYTVEKSAFFYKLLTGFYFLIPRSPCIIVQFLVLLFAVTVFVRVMIAFDILDDRSRMSIAVSLMVGIVLRICMGDRIACVTVRIDLAKLSIFSRHVFIAITWIIMLIIPGFEL